MDKPNLIESVMPGSGRYSFKRDMHLNAWLGVAIVVYLGGLALRRYFPNWDPFARGAVALAPLIPSLLYGRSWWNFIRGLDELQQRVQLEAFLFAALGTIFVEVVIDTLRIHGVSLGFLRDGLGLGGVFMTMFALWLVGGAIANCRYK